MASTHIGRSATASAATAFEERYLLRAQEALSAKQRELGAVRLDLGKVGEGALAGWWCPPETNKRHAVLPNPWDDREAIGVYARYAWDISNDLLRELVPIFNSAHGERPATYWRILLRPWLLCAVSAALDRRLYLVAARELAPSAKIIAGDELHPPATMVEAAFSFRSERWNASLMTAMAAALGLSIGPYRRDAPTAPLHLTHRQSHLAWALSHPRAAAFAAAYVSARIAFGGRANRRVALLHSHYVFSSGDAAKLAPLVRGLRLTPGRRVSHPVEPPGEGHPARGMMAAADAQVEGGLEPGRLVAALLPKLIPRSLLEGYKTVSAESERRHGEPTNLVVGNYAFDEVDNDFIGRCLGSGRSVTFVQHGGAYMQIRAHQHERLERVAGTTFISWGARAPRVEPAPIPRLERLRDSYRGGDWVVLIEWNSPADHRYPYQFSTSPLANQVYDVPARLGEFVENVRTNRHHLALKQFPTFIEEDGRPAALAALRRDGPSRLARASEWMRRARVAVIPYPDTALIEAMLIGVPTIGLWSSDLWEMREDAAPHFEELARLGVFHDDPVATAAKLDAVYQRAAEWWGGKEIQRARHRFLERFAAGGDWRPRWVTILRGIKQGDEVAL